MPRHPRRLHTRARHTPVSHPVSLARASWVGELDPGGAPCPSWFLRTRRNDNFCHRTEVEAIPCVGTTTPSVDFGAVKDGEQVGEEFVGFVFDAVEDVGDVVEVGVGVAAGGDAAIVVALVEFDIN